MGQMGVWARRYGYPVLAFQLRCLGLLLYHGNLLLVDLFSIAYCEGTHRAIFIWGCSMRTATKAHGNLK